MLEFRPILNDKHKSLRKLSKIVDFPLSDDDKNTAQYLIDYLVFASDDENSEKHNLRVGVGLAAPQIGINKRIIAIYLPEFDEQEKLKSELKLVLINPKIISHSERLAYLTLGEGCLSVDEEHPGYVYRHAFLTVEGFNFLTNQTEKIKLRGYQAIVLQHEIDHLNGILFYDHINKKNPKQKIEGALEI